MTASSIYYDKLLRDVQFVLDQITITLASEGISLQCKNSMTGQNDTVAGNECDVVKALSEIIYGYYKRPAAVTRSAKENYLEKLRDRYRSDAETSRFRSGWSVEENDFDSLGSILVKKDNYYSKQVLSGAYLIDEYPIREGMPVHARWHLTSHNDVMGQAQEVSSFYEVSGTTLPNDYQMTDVLVRFYFNIDVDATDFESRFLNFFGSVAVELNRRFVPFQFKVIYKSESMGRADTAVLYIDKRYFFLTIDFILSLSQKFAGLLGEHTPLFTYEIAQGIGFAEQPPLDKLDNLHFDEIASFGQHRSAIIARGIIECYKSNHTHPLFDPRDAAFLLKFLSKYPMSAGATVLDTSDASQSHRFSSAFFLNRKSNDYPYVASYFDSGCIPTVLSKNPVPIPAANPSESRSKRLAAATMVGYKLCSEAIWDSYNRCSWLTFGSERNYITLNNGLADGLAGIVVFLDQLYKETANKAIGLHLFGAARCLSYKLRDKVDWVTKNKNKELVEARRLTHGYYQGDLPGFVVLKQNNLDLSGVLDLSAKSIIHRLTAFDPFRVSIYVSDGIAGSILALCEMADLFDKARCLAKAKELAEALIGHLFCFSEDGLTLKSQGLGVGFNFGAAGIAFALLKLSSLLTRTGSKLEMAAASLLEYERTQKIGPFWKLPNGLLESDVYHLGMIDIAISRLGLARYLPTDKTIQNELADALTFINTKISDNLFRIFDGSAFNFGIADLTLGLNALELPGNTWEHLISQVTKAVDDDRIQFTVAGTNRGFTPGMLRGYAGLGYFLLKIAKTELYRSMVTPW